MNRPDREQLATERIKVLEPELPFLAITVPALVRTVRGFEISRNGIPIQGAAWDTELPVDPGDVEIVEHAPGYKPKTLHITVARKEHASIAAVPLELAPIDRPPPAFWTAKRTTGFVLMIAGVVAAGGGAAVGALALDEKKKSDDGCPVTPFGHQCTQAGVNAMSKASTDAVLSDVGFGLAAVGVGLGAYFFFTGAPHERPAGVGSGWSWLVDAGPRGASGTLTRSF
jgi:hypothetical protein